VLHGLERKGLIERNPSPEDRRGVSVHRTKRGKDNYALVRQEWASTVSAAAGNDTSNLDAALGLLRAVEAGLVSTRPATPGRPATLM
jgi:DNA-binding MarR family transcriptional regulator